LVPIIIDQINARLIKNQALFTLIFLVFNKKTKYI